MKTDEDFPNSDLDIKKRIQKCDEAILATAQNIMSMRLRLLLYQSHEKQKRKQNVFYLLMRFIKSKILII